MNSLEYVFGEICKVLFPISEDMCLGNQDSSIALCTLSSINLFKEISSSDLINNVAIVGRLFSENKGIDSIIRFVDSNKNIKIIILCGKEVWGHKAGSSLIALYENGIDDNGRIIDSTSPDPMLTVSKEQVSNFCNQVKIVNKIGETRSIKIKELIDKIKSQ